MDNPFDEIESYYFSKLNYKEKYSRLYNLLDRTCKQLTLNETADFSTLFARIYFLCSKRKVKSQPIEIFRIHARQVLQSGKFPFTEEDFLYDVKALCETLSQLLDIPVPERLQEALPAHWRPLPQPHYTAERRKRLRMIVDSWDDEFIYGSDEACPGNALLQVRYTDSFSSLKEILFKGAQLNLLSVTSDEAGVLQAELYVFEPDYLIDISSLSACYTNYGDTPLNYLMNKFRQQESTHYILLGNAANQFLDDCVNASDNAPAAFDTSIQKAFRTDLLAYCVTPDIARTYFKNAKEQFEHIRQTLVQLFNNDSYRFDKNQVLLEPSFLCECMGLQGRMDLLQGDGRNLIELKSGKADGWNGVLRPKTSHALQMALYKEILYYNLDIPREEVSSYLFYSVYPKLYAERSAKGQIQKAIELRNRIVANEIRLKNGEGETIIESLTPDSFNEKNDQGKLWLNYQRPQIISWLMPFQQASPLERAYFYSFLSFTEKEQFLSKIGDSRPDSSRGFADTWNADLDTKQNGGNILTGLTIRQLEGDEGIEHILLEIPYYNENFLPNFRKGDIILLYERNNEEENATNRQVLRGSIESLSDTETSIKLRNKQRNVRIFNLHSQYAIEHDFMDSAYNTLYKGLYTFLTAPTERKELLLCQRTPQRDVTRTLTGDYLNGQINQIVLQAKQALDYFLLIGPPGTGKTSVALKSMVEEFYAEPTNQLLLLSYTNRAVDEICEMLERIEGKPAYVRIGSELSCEASFRHRLIQNITQTCRNRDEIKRTLIGIRSVVGTTASISGKSELFKLKHFQVAIIDEASQILEPHIIGILSAHNEVGQCAIGKFVLIGDPKQLPAVVQQNPSDSTVDNELLNGIGLTDRRNSLFERLYNWQHLHPQEGMMAMLNRQGRTHPVVNDFANHYFYNGRLDIVPVKHQTEELEFAVYPQETGSYSPYIRLIATTRVGFIPSGFPPIEDSNKINRNEAQIIASIVKGIYELCQLNGLPFHASKRIGIIVPFRNQIALVGKALRQLQIPETEEITIDTVERYQGSQREIILFSATISQPYQLDILSTPIQDNGVWIDRKLNVALTRAQKQLFVTGNEAILSRSPIYDKFIKLYSIEKKP